MGRGGRGGRGGGVDLEPPPSTSGDVASQLQLEASSRDEPETESRDEEESRPEAEADAEAEVEVEATGKLRIRGEAGGARGHGWRGHHRRAGGGDASGAHGLKSWGREDAQPPEGSQHRRQRRLPHEPPGHIRSRREPKARCLGCLDKRRGLCTPRRREIGRASCRERVYVLV